MLPKHSTYLSNISIALPLSKKLKFGFGYQPYSSKRYDILTKVELPDGTFKGNHFKDKVHLIPYKLPLVIILLRVLHWVLEAILFRQTIRCRRIGIF